MKKTKMVISLVLSLLILISTVTPALASANDWDSYWNNAEVSRCGLTMQPGSDETERNFSWYITKGNGECSVLVGKKPNLSDAKEFKGTSVDTYEGDKCAKVTVTGLQKGKKYYYATVSDGKRGEIYSFETLSGNSFSALFVSDIHIVEDNVSAEALYFDELIQKANKKSKLNMIISAGDQTMGYKREEFIGMPAAPTSRGLTFAFAVGNHDKGVSFRDFKNFPNEYKGIIDNYQAGDYWFRKGNVLFLYLNSNNSTAMDHHNFVSGAVKANPDAKWRVVVMHHDLYADSIEARKNGNRTLRILYTPIFDEFNIDLALLGHSHHFSVSDVIYNGRKTASLSDGGTVRNPQGTVYAVSSSLTRPRVKDEGLHYSDYIAMGMDDPLTPLYNIIEFSDDAIKFTAYNYDTDEKFAGFTIEKDENWQPMEYSSLRKYGSIFVNSVSVVVGFFENINERVKLREKGFDVPLF